MFDRLLEAAVLDIKRPEAMAVFWDVDAPATIDRVRRNPDDPFRPLIPRYDLVFTYGGGPPAVKAYRELGARQCVPVYNALDPSTHYRVAPDPRYRGDLGFLGNRLPDREARVDEFFLRAAELSGRIFLLGGNGWGDKPLPANVKYLGHIYTFDHNAFNSTPLAVLNISRESMARYGFSPATRVFEAAGAGACIITDSWEGIELFLELGREVLVARNGSEVAEHLSSLTPERARAIGNAALERVLAEHTYSRRAAEVEEVLVGRRAKGSKAAGGRSAGPAGAGAAPRLRMVFLGLSITSSWGNGHATTNHGLVRELAARGHDVLFLERDVPWYAANRDLPRPPYGRTELYSSLEELKDRFGREVREADFVMVGSFVPEGVAVGRWVLETARGTVAFYDIDTPVTMSKLERGDMEYLSPDLIPRFHLYLSFTGGPMLARVERRYGARLVRALYCSCDAGLYYPERVEGKWDLGYLGTYSGDRQHTLDRLMLEPARRWGDGRFIVAGPQYPADIEWPANLERLDHLPPGEHRPFYNAQRFTLNITRAEMLRAGWSPSVRLFEAAACATPIISDYWEGLDAFFRPGREILISRAPEDTLRYLRRMPEEERVALGERARARVLAAHTAAQRAAELEGYVLEAIASRRRALNFLGGENGACSGDRCRTALGANNEANRRTRSLVP